MDRERLEEIKKMDIDVVAFHLNTLTVFDGKKLSNMWKEMIKALDESI